MEVLSNIKNIQCCIQQRSHLGQKQLQLVFRNLETKSDSTKAKGLLSNRGKCTLPYFLRRNDEQLNQYIRSVPLPTVEASSPPQPYPCPFLSMGKVGNVVLQSLRNYRGPLYVNIIANWHWAAFCIYVMKQHRPGLTSQRLLVFSPSPHIQQVGKVQPKSALFTCSCSQQEGW